MKKVILTGGQGYLATQLGAHFSDQGWEVLSPGKDELDVTSWTSIQDYLDRHTGFECLIHTGGVLRDGVLLRMDESDWDEVIRTHLKGAMGCAKAAIPHFLKHGHGHIVFLGSHSAHFPPVGQVHYAAAKAGLEGLARSLARELGEMNIRVNVVLPGFHRHVKTEMAWQKNRAKLLESHVLNKLPECKELGDFLLSIHANRSLSGQVLSADSRPVFLN